MNVPRDLVHDRKRSRMIFTRPIVAILLVCVATSCVDAPNELHASHRRERPAPPTIEEGLRASIRPQAREPAANDPQKWAEPDLVRIPQPDRAAAGDPVRPRPDRIDVDTTIARLVALHCDSYLYEIPHGTDAWQKLPAFADAARRANIDVYVYLQPWTLAHRNGRNVENEPFGTDYVRWCEEVNRVAADHPSIRGVVMDDFQVNTGEPNADDGEHFTPAMVHKLRAALRAHGAKLQFVPVLYFYLPLAPLFDAYGQEFGDGAILCYPQSRREVEVARRYFNDYERGAALEVELPKHGRLRRGEGTFAAARLEGDLASHVDRLRFYLDDQNASARSGATRAVVRVDGRTVWSKELGTSDVSGKVDIELKNLRPRSRVEIGLVVDEPSDEGVVHIEFSQVRLVDAKGTIDHRVQWADDLDDGIHFEIAQSAKGERRWTVPMTLLVAAAPFEHEKRFDEAGTPKNIAAKVSEAMGWCREGLARGVIAWYAPLAGDSDVAKAIRRVYAGPETSPQRE